MEGEDEEEDVGFYRIKLRETTILKIEIRSNLSTCVNNSLWN